MATANYDEASHTNPNVGDWNTLDPLYRWDTHFPERLSRLHMHDEFTTSQQSSPSAASARRQRRNRSRNCARFKTQPITFDEIKEVDEEGTAVEEAKKDLKTQFTAFSRSMDGLLPGLPGRKRAPQAATAASQGAFDRNVGIPVVPIEAAPASNKAVMPTEESSSNSVPTSCNDSTSTCVVATLPPALVANLPQLDHSRGRRSKRRARKSIEEEPELELKESTSAVASQEATPVVASQEAG